MISSRGVIKLISPSQSYDNLFITYLNSNLVSAILNVLSGTKKRYPGQKTISGTISFLCPRIITLIKAQVCDNL